MRLTIAVRCRLSFLLTWQQTLLPVQQLLCWLVDSLGFTVGDRYLSTLLVGDRFTVRPGLSLTTGAVLHFTTEGVGHPHICHLLWLVIPNLMTVNDVS